MGGGTDGAAGCQGGQQQLQLQATAIAALEGGGARGSGSQAAAEGLKTGPALFDPMAPCSLDVVLPHPADAADAVPGKGRSLPPTRRSPGPRSRDAGQSLQMAQMMEMMKVMTHHLQEVKAQVGKLQQDHDPSFPFRPLIPYDTDDEE